MSSQQPVARSGSTRRYPLPLLVGGLLGRTWLWFVGACVAITLLPVLVGWRPYVVQSGSMEPRIDVGDVVLAAPVSDPGQLLGRVTVFTDPEHPSTTKTHRVVGVNADGTLRTKGDANPTADSAPVPFTDVRGLGRVLVRFTGLPLVWVRTGQWFWLLAFLLSLALAAAAASRDHEDDEEGGEGEGDPPAAVPLPTPSRGGLVGASALAAGCPADTGLRRVQGRWPRGSSSGPRAAAVLAGVGAAGVVLTGLLVPASGAALTASTVTTGNTWTLRGTDYPTMVSDLAPWLYWRLDDTSGDVAVDSSPYGRTGIYAPDASPASITRGVTGALTSGSPNLAVTLNGTTACVVTTDTTPVAAPSQLTEMVWFRTTTTSGGKLLGFESPRTGVTAVKSGGAYDRQLYLDAAGRVWFGIGTSTKVGIKSQAGLNDGSWHMAAATLGPDGMLLYIDGVLEASKRATAAASYSGWWRAGCGNLSGWAHFWDGGGSPTGSRKKAHDFPFAGSLDEVTVFTTPLTAAQIAALYAAR